MGNFKKTWKKMVERDIKGILAFGLGFVRVLILASIILLLLYSLVFNNFVIILVILLQALALVGTFFDYKL